MLYLVRNDGTIEAVEGAETGELIDEQVVCYDAAGKVVTTFLHRDVFMFGSLWTVTRAIAGQEPE